MAMLDRLEWSVLPLGRFPRLYRISERVEGAREIPVPPYLVIYQATDEDLHALKKPTLLPGAPFVGPGASVTVASMILPGRTIML